MIGPEGYEFGNARVRAMRSRLLSGPDLLHLLDSRDADELILNLADTTYRESIEGALLRERGVATINDALQRELVTTLGKLPGFYAGDARQMVALALGKYEIHNVITGLRAVVQQVPASDTAALMLPVGELTAAQLRDLSRSSDLRAALSLLATWQSPLALPLLDAAAQRPRAGLPFLELALTCWYQNTLEAFPTDSRSWRTLSRLEIDTNNLLLALRLAGHPRALATLQESESGAGHGAYAMLFCGEGSLSRAELGEIARQPTLAAALAVLGGTSFGSALVQRRPLGSTVSSLEATEHELLGHQLQTAARVFAADALGIGVPLAYIQFKTAEISNIRLIAQAVALEMERAWALPRLLLRPDQKLAGTDAVMAQDT